MNARAGAPAEGQAAGASIWTIGHSTRPLAEFLALLAENGVQAIADVRSHPGSRHYPQYGQQALHDALLEAGLAYYWLPALGGRRRARADSANTAWRNPSFRGYADYMQTAPFARGLDELLGLALDRRTSLMCAEAVWWRCHRSMIADALKAHGLRVLHIMGAHSVSEHPWTAPARLVDGQLSYATPPPGPD
jgi:uncharacterized protein (DUF488 family)